jgi:hypothetical protein
VIVDFNKTIMNTDIPERKSSGHNHGPCEVNGCPRQGHIHMEGRWNCRYHFGVGGRMLGHVTVMLTNHAAEVDWYEQLLLGTAEVEYACSNLKASAPRGYEPVQSEDFYAYRKRVEGKIKELLKARFTEPLPYDGKAAASGEKPTFLSMDDVLPDFER